MCTVHFTAVPVTVGVHTAPNRGACIGTTSLLVRVYNLLLQVCF